MANRHRLHSRLDWLFRGHEFLCIVRLSSGPSPDCRVVPAARRTFMFHRKFHTLIRITVYSI